MEHPTRYELDRWVAGEEVGDFASHIKGCNACRAYTTRRERERKELLTRMPADQFFETLERRERERPKPRRLGWRIGLAVTGVVAVVALLLVVWPASNLSTGAAETPDATGDGMRWMGGQFAVRVFVKRGERVFVGGDEAVRPGDKVQFEVTAKKEHPGYAAVAVVDEKGVNVLLPEKIKGPATIVGRALIPGSVVIDAAGAGATLIVVVRDEPFLPGVLESEIRALTGNRTDFSNVVGLRYRLKVAQ